MGGGAAGGEPSSNTYSHTVALIYIFNLIVGTGALALPSVLTTGGWCLGFLFLLIIAGLSYVGVTFMVESMAAANAMLYAERKAGDEEVDELLNSEGLGSFYSAHFEISRRTELGQMAEMFFGSEMRVFFYVALVLYLYGDAAIYCTFVPRSLVEFFYGQKPPSWAFDGFLALFLSLILPFCFYDFQKTKLLQVGTMAVRNLALFTMIALALQRVTYDGPQIQGVPTFRLSALPNLFGGAVYAFMCHHSLPGIITPVRDKSKVAQVLRLAFVVVFVIYMFLFLACGLAFGLKAEDPITFNFPPEKFGIIGDLLLLFPVFTLSSNFPMLSITLRNNLDTLLFLVFPRAGGTLPRSPKDIGGGRPTMVVDSQYIDRATTRRVLLTLLAVIPPILCCLAAEHWGVDVNSLVGVTGAYAGAAVMFIIPACLVHCSRIVVNQELPVGADLVHFPFNAHPHNPYASPFRKRGWVLLLIIFAIFAMFFITYEKFYPS